MIRKVLLVGLLAALQVNAPSEAQKCHQIRAEFEAKVAGEPLNSTIAESFKDCYKNCTEHPHCQTLNFNYLHTKECNLMQENVHEMPKAVTPTKTWLFIENKHHPCNQFPDPCAKGRCWRDPLHNDTYKCLCPREKTSGKRCEIPYVQLNTLGQICFGGEQNSFGELTVPVAAKGQVYAFKLEHLSGSINCDSTATAAFWGCTDPDQDPPVMDFLALLTLDGDNNVVAPQDATMFKPMVEEKRVVFRVEDDGIFLQGGETLKLWHSEDQKNSGESDNGSSKTCANIYAAVF